MKDHYSEHLELLETWKREVESMKEKSRSDDKEDKKEKKPDHVGLTPDLLDKKIKGLRIKDKTGHDAGKESTIVDVNGNTVTVAGPTGDLEKMSKTSVSSTKELD